MAAIHRVFASLLFLSGLFAIVQFPAHAGDKEDAIRLLKAKQHEKAFVHMQKAAEQGDADAQYYLSTMYQEGMGIKRNLRQAALWRQKAANQGLVNAMVDNAIDYEEGRGVSKNPAKAAEWYRKAADKGDHEAQNKMGEYYLSGIGGLPRDEKESFKWYLKSAEQGNVISQYMVALDYKQGRGTKKDINKAVKWYTDAAKQGDTESMQNLAMICLYGDEGYKKDIQKGIALLRTAAEKGQAASQYTLGMLYAEGKLIDKDMAEAKKWLGKAAAQGDEQAKAELTALR